MHRTHLTILYSCNSSAVLVSASNCLLSAGLCGSCCGSVSSVWTCYTTETHSSINKSKYQTDIKQAELIWDSLIYFPPPCVTAPSGGNREEQPLIAGPQSVNERAVPTNPPLKHYNRCKVLETWVKQWGN